jgi:hypothetical protein
MDLSRRGPLAGLWKGANGRESLMFAPTLDDNMTPEQSSNLVNSLRNGVIKKVTLKEHQSTFPFTMGVNLSCCPPNEVTNIGEKFTYCVLPNSVITTEQVLHQSDHTTLDNSAWHNLYSQWDSSNLETLGVMDVPNNSFVFVHMNHPAVGLLRYNQQLIGCDIDAQPKLENEYLKISKQVMATCCQTIRDDVLNKMKVRNLNEFSLQVSRLNNAAWDEMDHNVMLGYKADLSLTEEEQHNRKAAHAKEYMTKPYQYNARIEIEYDIPHTT